MMRKCVNVKHDAFIVKVGDAKKRKRAKIGRTYFAEIGDKYAICIIGLGGWRPICVHVRVSVSTIRHR